MRSIKPREGLWEIFYVNATFLEPSGQGVIFPSRKSPLSEALKTRKGLLQTSGDAELPGALAGVCEY